jgi:hypothetical protein
MIGKALKVAVLWALAAFAISAAAFWPALIHATGQESDAAAVINQPRLEVNGCVVTVASADLPDGRTQWTVNDKPSFDVTIRNPGDQPADVPVALVVMSASVESPYSRSPSIARKVWDADLVASVPAGAQKIVRMVSDKPLPAGTISVLLSARMNNIVAMAFPATNGFPTALGLPGGNVVRVQNGLQ